MRTLHLQTLITQTVPHLRGCRFLEFGSGQTSSCWIR